MASIGSKIWADQAIWMCRLLFAYGINLISCDLAVKFPRYEPIMYFNFEKKMVEHQK